MVERFGLFTIVVLGEVVIGVVEGLSEVEDRTALTVTVAMLGLTVGMGLWWNYYDVSGRRVPSQNGVRLATWTYIDLPLTTSIVAAGAAMVSLVEHAEDSRTPEATAWLLGGSVAVALLCVGLASRALNPDDYPGRLLERVPGTLAAGARWRGSTRPKSWFLRFGGKANSDCPTVFGSARRGRGATSRAQR